MGLKHSKRANTYVIHPKHRTSFRDLFRKSHRKSKQKTSLLILDNDVLTHIFGYLTENELLIMRKVCQTTKLIAEDLLKSRVNELTICERQESYQKVNTLFTIYNQAKRLCLKHSLFTIQELMTLCNQKLSKLESIKLCNQRCDTDLLSIAAGFSNLVNICLQDLNVRDAIVGQLLKKLVNLRSIEIQNCPITGECFASIQSSLKSIKWTHDKDTDICEQITFNNSKLNLTHFDFRSDRECYSDGEIVVELIVNECPHLEYLKLDINSWILNYTELNLKELQVLDLRIMKSDGDYRLTDKFQSLKKLTVDVSDIDDVNLIAHLSNAPNVEELEITISIFNRLDQSFIDTLTNLRSLKCLTFNDWYYEYSRCHSYEDANKNNLIELVTALEHVSRFTFRFFSVEGNDYCVELINAFEELALRRRHQKIEINFFNEHWKYRMLPVNLYVYFPDLYYYSLIFGRR